jgi:GT2 family glycosyltransferase
MKIDLLIATKGRNVELAEFLRSLRTQTFTGFRVFIGDQNPPEYLAEVRREFADLPVTWVSLSVASVSKARNALLELVEADLFAFPDDDCVYEPDTLERVVHFFQHHPEAEALLGQWCGYDENCFPKNRPPVPVNRYQCFYRGETFVQFYRVAPRTSSRRFDPVFGFGEGAMHMAAEDTDFLLGLIDSGSRCYRDNSVHIHHHKPNFNRIDPVRTYGYGEARSALLRKHSMPYFFIAFNLFYPLIRILMHPERAQHHWAMFRGRRDGWFRKKSPEGK